MSKIDDIESNVEDSASETTIEQLTDNSEIEPTTEELATLEHIADRIPLTAWLIVICEFCERFAFIGLFGPLQNYIQFPVPGPNDKQPGALGRGHRTATLLTTCFQFFCYFTPIGGAILADQFWGKYKTIVFGCVVYVLGLLILVLTSIPYAINAGIAFPGLIAAMIILSFATGALKSNVSPLMAQQYTRTKPIVIERHGQKKIIDPSITLQSMFSWFYWTINFGALSSIISTNVEKYYSYWLAFLLPVIVFAGSIIVLTAGRRRYIRTPPNGSLIVRACRVTITAIRMRWRLGRQHGYRHILDYAKESLLPIDYDDKGTVTELNQNEFINDLKQAWSACRVFAFFPFYWVCSNQLISNMVSQAAQMNVGPLPNDLLQNIAQLVTLFLIPFFDKLIYPALRRYHIKFTLISRIALGFFFASIAMGWTALVQHMIYSTGPNYDYTIKPCPTCQKFNDITAAWQIPSYVFMAIAEIFAAITGLEYAFTQAPSSMKSIVVSLFLFTSGLGSALNFVFLPVLVDPKLVYMYASLSITALVMGVIFFLLFRNDQKRDNDTSSSQIN